MTVSDVRNHLNEMGFDFRQYKANPLASVGTTLKRIAATSYVQTMSTGSGTLYMREAPLDKLKMLSDLLGRTIPEAVERDNMHSMKGLDSSRVIPVTEESTDKPRRESWRGKAIPVTDTSAPKAPIPPASMRKKLGLDK